MDIRKEKQECPNKPYGEAVMEKTKEIDEDVDNNYYNYIKFT